MEKLQWESMSSLETLLRSLLKKLLVTSTITSALLTPRKRITLKLSFPTFSSLVAIKALSNTLKSKVVQELVYQRQLSKFRSNLVKRSGLIWKNYTNETELILKDLQPWVMLPKKKKNNSFIVKLLLWLVEVNKAYLQRILNRQLKWQGNTNKNMPLKKSQRKLNQKKRSPRK